MALNSFINLVTAAIALIVGPSWPKQATLQDNAVYDYIVIGAGTAGSIVAANLAKDGQSTVLVLEAGGDPTDESLLPGNFANIPETALDYNFTSTYDPYAAGSRYNYTRLTSGKMLGGTSGLNHFILVRGTPSVYNYWAEVTQDESWNYDNVLPYFKKVENVQDKEIQEKYAEYHGDAGLIGVTRQTNDKAVKKYFDSFVELGNPTVIDLNANDNVGYSQPQLIIANGIRQSSAYTYLRSVKDNKNLFVSKSTTVSKILFDGNTAVAVEAIYKDKTYTFKAKKEIILSAGVYKTPQILMLSGIGKKEHLEEWDIDVVADLPVGDNLIDPPGVTVVYKTVKYASAVSSIPSLVNALIPTKLPFPVFVGSIALNKSATEPDYQNYNLIIPHDTPFLKVACESVYGFRTEVCERLISQVKNRDVYYTTIANLDPKSRGQIRLKSTNPFDDPEIKTGYYEEPEDLEAMLSFVKDHIRLSGTKFFKDEKAELVGLDLPECADIQAGTDDFWRCYIREMSVSPFLYTSTCPMGAVVDGDLKVIGVNKLRVTDASVLPKLPRSAPLAAVLMLAEKASDMIKGV